MNFFTAGVEVKVDPSKLPQQLNRVKDAVMKTVTKVRAAFGRMATSFKAAFDKIVRYAKYGALAVVGALTLMTRAAMKQEDAVFGLVAALKVSGEYSATAMERLKDFASATQKVTIYGDEAILAQMAFASAMGVTEDKLEGAARAAIGLSVITKNLESAMVLVAKAAAGETGALSRYGIIIDKSLSKQEKFNELMKIGSKLFQLAEERAKTASGGLRQMWNALGDVAEIIGDALLPTVRDSARAIKEWAERNQERIGEWAKEAVRYIGLAKDAFVDWVGYLKRDWKAGVKLGLGIVLELFKGFWQSSVIIMKAAGREVGRAFCSAFGDTIAEWYAEFSAMPFWKQLPLTYLAPIAEAIVSTTKKMREGTLEETIAVELKRIAKTTAASIKAMMEITQPKLTLQQQYEIALIKQRILDIDKERAVIAERIAGLTAKEAEATIQSIKNTEDVFESAGGQIKEQITSWKRGVEEFSWALENSIARGLENSMRDFDNWGDHLLRMFEEIYWSAIRIAFIDPIARAGAGALTGLLTGGIGQAAVPVMVGGEMGSLSAASRSGLQHGGYVEETGWAKVHKGETYSGVNNEVGDTVVNISDYVGVDIEVNEYKDSDQRIVDVALTAAAGNGAYRRAHNIGGR